MTTNQLSGEALFDAMIEAGARDLNDVLFVVHMSAIDEADELVDEYLSIRWYEVYTLAVIEHASQDEVTQAAYIAVRSN
jgi:hypothetical protein